MIPKKATLNKVRFHEVLDQIGEVGDLYVNKDILEYLNVYGGEIAVRIVSTANFHNSLSTGGDASASTSRKQVGWTTQPSQWGNVKRIPSGRSRDLSQ